MVIITVAINIIRLTIIKIDETTKNIPLNDAMIKASSSYLECEVLF